MKVLLINREGRLEVQTFFPMGGAMPTGIYVAPGEVIMLEVKPGAVEELARETLPVTQ